MSQTKPPQQAKFQNAGIHQLVDMKTQDKPKSITLTQPKSCITKTQYPRDSCDPRQSSKFEDQEQLQNIFAASRKQKNKNILVIVNLQKNNGQSANLQLDKYQNKIMNQKIQILKITLNPWNRKSLEEAKQFFEKQNICQSYIRVVWIISTSIFSSRMRKQLSSILQFTNKFNEQFNINQEKYQILLHNSQKSLENSINRITKLVNQSISQQIQQNRSYQSQFYDFLIILGTIVKQKDNYIPQSQNQEILFIMALSKIKIQYNQSRNHYKTNDIDKQIDKQEVQRILMSALFFASCPPDDKILIDQFLRRWLHFMSQKEIRLYVLQIVNSHAFSQQQLKHLFKNICDDEKSIIASNQEFAPFQAKQKQLFQKKFLSIKKYFSPKQHHNQQIILIFFNENFNKRVFQIIILMIIINIMFKDSSQKLLQLQTLILKNIDQLFDKQFTSLFSYIHFRQSKVYSLKSKKIQIMKIKQSQRDAQSIQDPKLVQYCQYSKEQIASSDKEEDKILQQQQKRSSHSSDLVEHYQSYILRVIDIKKKDQQNNQDQIVDSQDNDIWNQQRSSQGSSSSRTNNCNYSFSSQNFQNSSMQLVPKFRNDSEVNEQLSQGSINQSQHPTRIDLCIAEENMILPANLSPSNL